MTAPVFVCQHCDIEFPSQNHRIEHKLDVIIQQGVEIMAAQDDINAAVTAIQSVTAAVSGVVTDLQGAVANIQQELANLGTPVDTTALDAAVQPLNDAAAALQQAQQAVDALETPAAAAPAAPDAGAEAATA